MRNTRTARPKFIAIEGIDASGKETQARRLARYLDAHLLSFPNYGSPSGKLIKEHLQGDWWTTGDCDRYFLRAPAIDAFVFQALQTVNRLEMAQYIQTHLTAGGTLVADRYTVSGEVYGASDGLDPKYLNQLWSYLPQPDLTILIDIPVEESFQRRPNRGGDRYEEDREKLEAVRKGYLDLFERRAEKEPHKWVVVDGEDHVEYVFKEILEHIEK